MAELRVGILGLGQGRSHLRSFAAQPDCRVVALCDANAERLRAVGTEYGIDRRYASYDQLLEQRDVDVVVVATPDHLHGQHSLQALEAGKHVLSEIPMAPAPEEMLAIVQTVERTGKHYAMGNQVRYAPSLRNVKALVDQGRFGETFYGEAEYLHDMRYAQYWPDGSRKWRADLEHPQTTLLGGGPHAMDCLRWLMGVDNFVEAFAYGNRFGLTDRPIDDFTVAIFKAANGACAKIAVSYGLSRPYCLYYSLYGTNGTFERARDQDRVNDRVVNYVYFKDIPFVPRMIPMEVINRQDPSVGLVAGHGTMEVSQAADFVKAILKDEPPPINAREAARSCLPLAAALESARTGKPVSIPAV